MVTHVPAYIPTAPQTESKEHFASFLPRDFSLRSASEYYATMRLFGYVFQGTYSPAARKIDEWKGLTNKGAGKAIDASGKPVFWDGKQTFNIIEVCTFLAITAFNWHRDRTNYKKTMGGAVAAEQGLHPESVEMEHLNKSTNPIVKSVISRYRWQNFVRVFTDLAFGASVNMGIVFKAFGITFERAVSFEHIAYDVLKNMLHEVQAYNMGDYERHRIKTGLIRTVQRALIDDQRKDGLSETQIKDNDVVFERMTQLVADKKFGINECVYMLGRVIDRPNSPGWALKEIDEIASIGLKEYAQQKKAKTTEGQIQKILAQGKRNPLDVGNNNLGLSIS